MFMLRLQSVCRLGLPLKSGYCYQWKSSVTKNVCQIPRRGTISTPTADQIQSRAVKAVGKWLAACSGMAFGAVVLGGMTRITESGLSMVDWHAVKERPPLNQADWEKEFQKYQQFPEFKIKNKDMTLSEFKFIWWMEYLHRTWGRAIGAVFFLPAVFFWSRGYFKNPMKIRVAGMGLLLAGQGLMGWYMVQSGLKEKESSDQSMPRVSQYRLAAHLGLAFMFYSLLLWNSLTLLLPPQKVELTKQMKHLWRVSHMTKTLTFFTAISGAFVAGLSAGLIYNTFPKFEDRWVPSDINSLEPQWRNWTENPAAVQYNHRILGMVTLGLITYAWIRSRGLPLTPRQRLAVNALMVAGVTQVSLGITTLLLMVPKMLAILHQGNSLVVFSTAIWLNHELKALRKMPRL